MAKGDRGFQELSVTRVGCQTATQRFGPHRHFRHPGLDDFSDSEDEFDPENHGQSMPRMEEFRMNLTVLSQCHNLYFAAYGDKVYVHRPLSPRQTLPSDCLVIDPSPRLPWHPARYTAQIINHLVVGNLGFKEILLLARHDGDVLAYYTDAIEAAVQSHAAGYPTAVTPFFRERVGNSAWGLAIHSQSRLIAVGSNAHEVQVFAFALNLLPHQDPPRKQPKNKRNRNDRFPEEKGLLLGAAERRAARAWNFRRVLRPCNQMDNIPSLTFADDTEGDAESVVAKDIKGFLWFLNIWDRTWQRLSTAQETSAIDAHRGPIGWGVMMLPMNVFKPASTAQEMFGCPKHMTDALERCTANIDISHTLRTVKNYNPLHGQFGINATPWTEDMSNYATDGSDAGTEVSDDDSLTEESSDEMNAMATPMYIPESVVLQIAAATGASLGQFISTSIESSSAGGTHQAVFDESSASEGEEFSSNLPSSSSSSTATPVPLITLATEQDNPESPIAPHLRASSGDLNRPISTFVPSGQPLIHSNRHTFALLPISDRCPPTHCHNALRQEIPHGAELFPRAMTDYDRMDVLACIPELSLVLIASQVGRVALCTITRRMSEKRPGRLGKQVSMRVEAVLPTDLEELEKLRPSFGLLGMAVGPVISGTAKRSSEFAAGAPSRADAAPKRFRLMLHYYDHTILSYELSRGLEGEDLTIF